VQIPQNELLPSLTELNLLLSTFTVRLIDIRVKVLTNAPTRLVFLLQSTYHTHFLCWLMSEISYLEVFVENTLKYKLLLSFILVGT